MKKPFFAFSVVILAIGAGIVFAACGGTTEQTNTETSNMENMDHDMADMDHDKDDMEHDGSEEKKEAVDFSAQRSDQTSAIIDAFGEMQKELDAEDKEKVAAAAKTMLTALEKIDSAKVADDKKKEFPEIIESAKEHAEHIVKSDIAHQKEHFEELTGDLKDLFAIVNTAKQTPQDK